MQRTCLPIEGFVFSLGYTNCDGGPSLVPRIDARPASRVAASAMEEITYIYTGQKKVALVDVETHDSPIPLESYTMRQGKVWETREGVGGHLSPRKAFYYYKFKRM